MTKKLVAYLRKLKSEYTRNLLLFIKLVKQNKTSTVLIYSGLVLASKLNNKLKSKSILVTIDDSKYYVRPGSLDYATINEVSQELSLVTNLDNKTDIGLVIDAGAYIGASAINLSRIYNNATIIAIEPSKKNFELLTKNIELCGNSRIVILRKALMAGHSSKNVLLKQRGSFLSFSIVEDIKQEGRYKAVASEEYVETIDIRELFKSNNTKEVLFMKCDIEGGEKELFKELQSVGLDIRYVLVETHDRIVTGCTESVLEWARKNDKIVDMKGEKIFLSNHES